MPQKGSLIIAQELENDGVFRAAWMLLVRTPTGGKTVEMLKGDAYKTTVTRGTQTGAMALAFKRLRLGKTQTNHVARTNVCTIEMRLLNAVMLAKLDGHLPMLAPHTMTSLLAAVIHHELRHAVGRSSEGIDKRLDYHQDRGRLAEPLWRSRDPEHQQFLNELKITMPARHSRTPFNRIRRRQYDELLLRAHDPTGARQPLPFGI
jgi:hypothetical protein